MPSPDQDATLEALLAGELPAEVVFDPITDNDSTGSCLGCAYSVLGSAAVLVACYTAAQRYGVSAAARFLEGAGTGGIVLSAALLTLGFFTLVELLSAKEIYVLSTDTVRLELRRRRWSRSTSIRHWDVESIRRFVLDPRGEDPQEASCLYVVLEGEAEPIRLLEPSYPRDFVERVEQRVSEICGVPSTT